MLGVFPLHKLKADPLHYKDLRPTLNQMCFGVLSWRLDTYTTNLGRRGDFSLPPEPVCPTGKVMCSLLVHVSFSIGHRGDHGAISGQDNGGEGEVEASGICLPIW